MVRAGTIHTTAEHIVGSLAVRRAAKPGPQAVCRILEANGAGLPGFPRFSLLMNQATLSAGHAYHPLLWDGVLSLKQNGRIGSQ